MKTYTTDQIKRIIDDYNELIALADEKVLPSTNVIKGGVFDYTNDMSSIGISCFNSYGDFDYIKVPIEYFSMTKEDIKFDRKRRAEIAERLAEEEYQKSIEEAAALYEKDERALYERLKQKYEGE